MYICTYMLQTWKIWQWKTKKSFYLKHSEKFNFWGEAFEILRNFEMVDWLLGLKFWLKALLVSAHMFGCVCFYVVAFVCVYKFAYVYTYTYTYIYICTYTWIQIICIYTCVSVFLCADVCTYIRIYTHMNFKFTGDENKASERPPAGHSFGGRLYDMTHSYVWRDSFICVDITYSYVWHL